MPEVVVVGAGLAGLTCARDLQAAGVDTLVLEAAAEVGGRVRTEVLDGYRLDRGFQIVLEAYPALHWRLGAASLDLRWFAPALRVRLGRRWWVLGDPRRAPAALPSTLAAPVGGAADKLRLAAWVRRLLRTAPRDLLRRPDTTTRARLKALGFSGRMIGRLWRPLLGGIQLDPDLGASARMAEVVLRTLAAGRAGVPRAGMGEIPRLLATGLAPGSVRLDAPVAALDGTVAVLGDGERVTARAVVVATDGPGAHRLLGAAVPPVASRPVAACWFALPSPPLRDPVLLLDGDDAGPVTNAAVMSEVSPDYAPPGRALLVAAVPGPEALAPGLATSVRDQLTRWFGATRADLEPVAIHVIPHGHPAVGPPLLPRRRVALGEGRFVCGDHRDTPSIQGAVFSGARTAAAVLAWLRG